MELSSARLRAFVLLRYTLIIATAYLLLAEGEFAVMSPFAALLIALALASNVALAQLPRRVADSMRFAVALIIFDTGWVTVALMVSGGFSADFYLLYLLVLLLAAIGENLLLIAVASCVVCAAYLFGHAAGGEGWEAWTSPSLIRIPFLFTTAVFYGFLVDRTRQESRRAVSAETLAAQLARTVTEFKLLYAKAQEAERIKTEFLATVSHELRTPLTSLMGYVDLLIDDSYGPVSADQRTALGRVRSASRILQQAIARMLDASRIDFGHERLSCDEFDLNELLDDVCRELPGAAGVTLQRKFEPNIPPLRTDEEKVRTIVRNLIENACQYTERGFVRVESRWNRERDAIEIAVADSGIGVAPGEMDAIFEAFRQGSNRRHAVHNGVGLGLYIVQRLVGRLDGDVSVDSQLDMGSTFRVRLPRLLHDGAAVAAGSTRRWGLPHLAAAAPRGS